MSKVVMDNLDSLSNDELRLRLLEYGFANMPVTVNTRKLIVKKLRKHLEDEKSKLRRETIHVTKYSSDEDSSDIDNGRKKSSTTTTTTTTSKTNRRATIGGNTLAPLQSTTTTSTSKTNVRRSGRITPTAESLSKDSGPSMPPSVPDILEDTDEEEIAVKKVINSRRSKSTTPVTLSKTDPVTISVRHIKPTLENVIEHEIVINDESEEEFMSPAQRSPVKPLPRTFSPKKDYSSVISSSSSSTTTRKKTMYGPEDDEFEYTSNDGNIPLSQSTKIYESSFLNRNKPVSGLSSFQPRNSISTSYNNRYNASSSGAKKFGSNEFGYSGITSTTYAKPKTYIQEDEEDDDYEESTIQEKKLEKEVLNSPYLSKFAKRLSELRVDPLIPPGSESQQTQSKAYYTQNEIEPPRNIGRYSTKPSSAQVYQRGNIISRKSINSYKKDDKNSFFGQFRYEWNELNVKYKINRNLAILFILLIIIFIIVLLFF